MKVSVRFIDNSALASDLTLCNASEAESFHLSVTVLWRFDCVCWHSSSSVFPVMFSTK